MVGGAIGVNIDGANDNSNVDAFILFFCGGSAAALSSSPACHLFFRICSAASMAPAVDKVPLSSVPPSRHFFCRCSIAPGDDALTIEFAVNVDDNDGGSVSAVGFAVDTNAANTTGAAKVISISTALVSSCIFCGCSIPADLVSALVAGADAVAVGFVGANANALVVVGVDDNDGNIPLSSALTETIASLALRL